MDLGTHQDIKRNEEEGFFIPKGRLIKVSLQYYSNILVISFTKMPKLQKRKFNQNQIQPGMRGYLITCHRNKEKQATIEILSLFNEYFEKDHEFQGSLEDQLKQETSALLDEKEFTSIPTGTDCLVFIQTKTIEPVAFLDKILDDLMASKKKKTRYTSRIIPFEQSCKANLTEIKEMALKMVAPRFQGQPSIPYAILPRVRNNSHLDRDKIIQCIYPLIGQDHLVELKTPQLTILVHVLQTICGICIVEKYSDRLKFNLEMLAEG